MELKGIYLLTILLVSITLLQTSNACDIYYRNDRYERDDMNLSTPIWTYDWNHFSITQDCACAVKFHPCRTPENISDMCYDYGHNNGCELGLKQYIGERVKLAWGPTCNPPLGGERDDLIYDPEDGPVICSGKLEVGKNNCDEPFDQNIPVDPERCESACGADLGCDEVYPNTIWCDEGINKTCDSNCNYSEKCDSFCRLNERDEPCDRLGPGAGCCSGCYYVDLNGDENVDIYDIVIVAGVYGLDITEKWGTKCRDSICYNSTYDLNSDGKINIFDIIIVVRKFGTVCPQITQVKELGFSYSNILPILIVLISIMAILGVLKLMSRRY